MNIKEIQHRNRHLIGIKNEFEEYIFKERKQVFQERLEALIAKNTLYVRADLSKDATCSFLYNGVMYKAWHCREKTGLNKLIHPEMLPFISDLFKQEEFEVKEEQLRLMNYIGNSLITAKHTDDLDEMIPSRINQPLRYIDRVVFNIAEPMAIEAIEHFKEINKNGLNAFKKLFLIKLLLA